MTEKMFSKNNFFIKRLRSIYYTLCLIDAKNKVGKIVALDFLLFIIPLSFTQAFFINSLEDDFVRYNVSPEIVSTVLIVMFVLSGLFLDKRIHFYLKLLQRDGLTV